MKTQQSDALSCKEVQSTKEGDVDERLVIECDLATRPFAGATYVLGDGNGNGRKGELTALSRLLESHFEAVASEHEPGGQTLRGFGRFRLTFERVDG